MKIQCLTCREIVPIGAFRCARDGIEITCTACGETYFLPSSGLPDARSEPPTAAYSAAARRPAAPESSGNVSDSVDAEFDCMTCPKCSQRQQRANACNGCGLSAERFDGFGTGTTVTASPHLVALWQQCVDEWNSESAHQSFLDSAIEAKAFRFAAHCYRVESRGRPNDARATASLERLERLVAATFLSAGRTDGKRQESNYRSVLVLMAFLAVVAVMAGMIIFMTRAPGGSDSTNTPMAPAQTVTQPGLRGGHSPASHPASRANRTRASSALPGTRASSGANRPGPRDVQSDGD